jgi:hypothetical protein
VVKDLLAYGRKLMQMFFYQKNQTRLTSIMSKPFVFRFKLYNQIKK